MRYKAQKEDDETELYESDADNTESEPQDMDSESAEDIDSGYREDIDEETADKEYTEDEEPIY